MCPRIPSFQPPIQKTARNLCGRKASLYQKHHFRLMPLHGPRISLVGREVRNKFLGRLSYSDHSRTEVSTSSIVNNAILRGMPSLSRLPTGIFQNLRSCLPLLPVSWLGDIRLVIGSVMIGFVGLSQ